VLLHSHLQGFRWRAKETSEYAKRDLYNIKETSKYGKRDLYNIKETRTRDFLCVWLLLSHFQPQNEEFKTLQKRPISIQKAP